MARGGEMKNDIWHWKGVSGEFERFAFTLIAAFACYRFIPAIISPQTAHIPDELLLSIVLFVIGYMWMRRITAMSEIIDAQESLRDMRVGAIAALVHALEAKDEYTKGHSERVRHLSVELAQKIGLGAEQVGVLSRAAVLHDIGKLGVPDAVLHKESALTPEEKSLIENHPVRSAEILSTLGFLETESRVALLHHERLDGSGYCKGLKGDEIPIEAAIIGLVDTFDAMNTHRPYRGRLSERMIREELMRCRGVQHDAALVDAFLEVLAERPALWVRALHIGESRGAHPVISPAPAAPAPHAERC